MTDRTSDDDRQLVPTPVTTHGESSLRRWLLLDGHRGVVVALCSLVVFVGFAGLGAIDLVGVTDPSLVTSVLSAAITGVFTLVTITITINQLVLSRVLESPGRIADRIETVEQFRDSIERMDDRVAVAPTKPAAFLGVVLDVLEDRVDAFEDLAAQRGDSATGDRMARLKSDLETMLTELDRHLDDENTELFGVLSPVLNNEYSAYVYRVRQVRATTPDLSHDERTTLALLDNALVEVNRTRHYFKTLYLHDELATVSRYLLFAGFPALLVSFFVVLGYDGLLASARESVRVLIVSFSMTVVMSPFNVLFAYSLRIATVAKRTTTFGTFTPLQEMP
jgi:hypothetical protein